MAESDILSRLPADLRGALMLLTRFPIPAGNAAPSGASGAWAWPLAGLAVGLWAGLVAGLALTLGLPPGPAAALALAVQIMATGAMHEDGLADSADGLWGGWTRARRLEIMKDSRIGSYGVLALAVVGLMRWSALAFAFEAGAVWAPLIAAAVLSRAPMAAVMAALPNARGEGLAALQGRPEARVAAFGAALALAVALVAAGGAALAMALAAAAAAGAVALTARAKIGGQTGDILGATQQMAEAACLAVFCATL